MPWGFPSSEHRRLQVWRSEWQWLCLVRGLNHPVEDPVSGLRSNLLVVSKGVGGDWLLKLTSYLLPLPSLCRSWVDSTFSSPIACPKRLPLKRDSWVVRNPAWEPETLTPRERETEVWSWGRQSTPTSPAFSSDTLGYNQPRAWCQQFVKGKSRVSRLSPWSRRALSCELPHLSTL